MTILIYGPSDMECNRQNFFVFWTIFLPFYPINNLKSQNFKKRKKNACGHIILHVSHKWKPYNVWFLRYGAWQTWFFVILGHFLPLYCPLTIQNIKIFKKLKRCLEISSFDTIVPKIMIISYTVQCAK